MVAVNKAMAELTALALACDLTRVFTFQLVQPGTEVGIKTVISSAPVIGKAGGRLRSSVHIAAKGNVLQVLLTVARAVGHTAMASYGVREGLTQDSPPGLLAT